MRRNDKPWPKKSLAQIRAERDEVKATVTKGIDPATARKAAKIEAQAAIATTIAEAELQAAENKTVADLFEDWLRDGVSRQDGNAELIRSFKKDVLPLIGKKPIRNLTEKDLLAVLRSIKARGLNRAVVIRSKDIGQMLRWGEKRKPWRTLMPSCIQDRDAVRAARQIISRELGHERLEVTNSYLGSETR